MLSLGPRRIDSLSAVSIQSEISLSTGSRLLNISYGIVNSLQVRYVTQERRPPSSSEGGRLVCRGRWSGGHPIPVLGTIMGFDLRDAAMDARATRLFTRTCERVFGSYPLPRGHTMITKSDTSVVHFVIMRPRVLSGANP